MPHSGDAADDPAIWIHPARPARSTVIGTDKDGGLGVYDLRGRQLQYLRGGRPNNVDLRPGFALGGERVTIVAAEERESDQIVLYRVDPVTRRLMPVAARRIDVGLEVYGSCMYRSARTGRFYVFVSSHDGVIRQFRLIVQQDGRVDARAVRRFDVGGRTEGCVADDGTGHLFVGEEKRGIWRYAARPRGGRHRVLVDRTGPRGNLVSDVEGLALAELGPRRRYLIASSQGESAYAVYRRGADDRYVTTFRVVAGRVDGATDTDGIATTTRRLGPAFATGLLVAQDGHNPGANQNFKLVPWNLARIVAAGRR